MCQPSTTVATSPLMVVPGSGGGGNVQEDNERGGDRTRAPKRTSGHRVRSPQPCPPSK